MLDEVQIEQDIQFLLNSAETLGNAKGEMIYRDHMIKHILALEMQRAGGDLSAVAQKREAEASDIFKKAILALAKATSQYEKLKAEREARAMRCEVFRTIRADQRQFTRASR